jgi:hypothetical protein
MQLHVTKQVFNPELKGKAVYLRGRDCEGYYYAGFYLVREVEGEKIYLINAQGRNDYFYIYNFKGYDSDELGTLELTVLEIPNREE